MNVTLDQNNPGLKQGDNISGYFIKKVAKLEEINSYFYELEHTLTGTRHIHISRNDEENTFGVAFKTVPVDSTGVAHILEHTVLAGSNRFPVRDPFFSMLKRSLSTFMNAFTSADWTMYPFSTQNRKDFYNLMDIYLDAAFFPKIDELSFKQEGHRLEIEDDLKDAGSMRLVYKGVVYNEMKGAMSSPDQVLARFLLKALYPDTTYSHNSGGDPVVIPSLTYDQLKAFHKRHYHPSNSFFYTYGNMPLKEHLNFIQEKILKKFKRIDPKTDVLSQPRWNKPRKIINKYPLGESEDPSKKCQVCVAWLTTDIKDFFEILVLTLLEHILLGNSASPLRKALVDSKLGTALSDGTGFHDDNRDTMFVCGLKDVEESAAEEIETIVFDTLKSLVDKGINKKLIESAIHQIEFHRKEITNTPYPYGLKLLLTISGGWLHGADPERILRFDADLDRLKKELSRGTFFEDKIKSYFLDNPHRVLFTLAPDQLMESKEKNRVAVELESVRASLSKSNMKKIKEDAKALRRLQENIEDVSCLPTLELEDIPPSVKSVKETNSYGAAAACYNQPTSGIFYFEAAAVAGSFRKHLIPLIPFFCFALPRIGTTTRDYTEMAQLIDAHTGGIGLSSNSSTSFEKKGLCLPFISFSGKCLVRNQGRMFEIIQELLCKFAFSDIVRLKSLLFEYRAGLESMVVQSGHSLAMMLASRNLSTTCALSEIWHGVHQLQTIKGLTDDLTEDKLESVSSDLLSIGKNLFTRSNFKIALIGEDHSLSTASSLTASIQKALFHSPLEGLPVRVRTQTGGKGGVPVDAFATSEIEFDDKIIREGWSTSSAVSFVAQAFKTVRVEHEDAPALSVISKILRSMYLHREIREKGGAYGGFALYNSEDGIFNFGSYRDPHISATLKVYDGAAGFINSGRFVDEDVKEAILQVCSGIDRPDPPGPAAQKAFYRKIVSLSDETRKTFKERLLSLTRNKVIEVAAKYFDQNKSKRSVAVISGEQKLKEANEKLPDHSQLRLYRI
ncbi:MAG: insulinase family protein [Thermodesulfobacteriota bacterium]|nr:insulinase family protein [Thermodesulfobacteriota bacterium]